MMHQRLIQELRRVARRYRRLFAAASLSAIWFAIALAGICLLILGSYVGWSPSWAIPALAITTVLLSVLAVWLGIRRTGDPRWVARKIEAKHPELETMLLAALEQRPELPDGKFGFLQSTVITDALAHHRRTNWLRDVPGRRILAVQLAGLTAFAALLLVFGTLISHGRQMRALADPSLEDATSRSEPSYEVSVDPGDTEIERGTSLVVTARFATEVPDETTLVYVDDSGEPSSQPMSLSLSDPMFGTRIAGVQTPLTYAIHFAGRATREYRVEVFEFPELRRADAHLVFPEYTGMEAKRVEDTRRITAVEGTQLTLICHLNKPVAEAHLVDENEESTPLKASSEDPTCYTLDRVLTASQRCRLQLVDDRGRENKEPPEFVFNVLPNRRPDLKIEFPAKDVRVSPIEELSARANVWDDFGVSSYGVSYTLPGAPPQERTLGSVSVPNQRQEFDHVIDFEALQAKPDQLLAYHFWAEDVGPGGQVRRTMGDMYFAEVRHFEEIFRQGQQPPGGQGEQQQDQGSGAARQAEELAELQKQIINATWAVIRRETAAQPSGAFGPDARELQTGQSQALHQMAELAEQLEDARSKQHAAAVVEHMTAAIGHLNQAAESYSVAELPPALSAEQEAYQALLKLRAREHEVVRSSRQQSQQRPPSSASGSQSRAQQQLDQLELDNSQNRYETQRQATSPQEQAQRETLQVLNRLRELARRQADLNKRLKELQSALDAAETEEERREIREQLKRLREQQQQMLRDMDELAQRMERPENQERMSQTRQDLEQTRENIRQSTEALEQGQVSQAVASGTRAERQLEQMRDEFRQRAANRFSDRVGQLRDDARQLHENETDLAQRLDQLEQERPQSPGLRDEDDRAAIREAVDRQRQDLDRLLDAMRQTVEEAEEAEPLMAGQLYDAVREAQQQHIEDALEATGELLERGLDDQARVAERQAGSGIEQLREGVEQAAESVLGDEQEALRRAQQTVEELARELDDEIRQATGQAPQVESDEQGQQPGQTQGEASNRQTAGSRPEGGPQSDSPPTAESSQGQPAPGRQPADQQQGDRPPGDQQPSTDRQRGQRQSNQQQTGEQSGQQPTGRPSDQQSPADAEQPSTAQSGSNRQPSDRLGELPSLTEQQDRSPTGRQQQDGGRNQTATGPAGLERFRRPSGPMTGDFLRWSDQLRDVEEMIEDPEIRSDVARIRDAARQLRREMHQDFQGPNWDLVREFVADPLNELRERLSEELLRRQSEGALVPIDRDPVPPAYVDQVRRYYEQLGSGQ